MSTVIICISLSQENVILIPSAFTPNLLLPIIWKPHFLKDIANLERIQRRATKYILNDYYRSTTNYKDRLITFTAHVLVRSARPHAPAEMFKDPEDNINIFRYITLILYHLELVQQLAIN